MNTIFVCFVSAVVSTLSWVIIFASRGVSGLSLIEGVALAILGGVMAGWALSLSFTRRSPAWGPIIFAVALLLSPFFIPTSAPEISRPVGEDEPGIEAEQTGDVIVDVQEERGALTDQRRSGFDQGVENGREIGREEAYAPTKKVARSNEEVPYAVTRIGNNQWAIRFRMPGPDRIDTKLPFPLGQVYYISTIGTIPNLQVGWIDDREACKFAMPPSSEFSPCQPLRYRMCTQEAQNARVVFHTTLVPDGDYEIRITEANVHVGQDEYAPGVPLGRSYSTN